MATTGKTQPQKLLEEIIPRDESEKYPSDPEPLVAALPQNPTGFREVTPENPSEFPTIAEQQAYWDKKEKAAEPKPPRKWSLARRRKFNATVAKKAAGWSPVPPPTQEEPVQMVRFCPCCGRNIERFLA